MIGESIAALRFSPQEWVLDIGCGDGYLTKGIAERVPDGAAVGVDASPRMISAADDSPVRAGARFVVADARALPFGPSFDAAVSFNALHWVPDQALALAQIAAILKFGGRALLQLVCASARESLESVVMRVCQSPTWAPWFEDFVAPFTHPDPDDYGRLAATAGLTCTALTVTDREWDFGSRETFERWCGVGTTAWTDRLPAELRAQFVSDEVSAYEPIAGRPGLFRFTQMRVELAK